LKVVEYRKFGGVKQAITSTADKVYGDYPPAEQEQMRSIFLRLTRFDESDGRRDTRRRVTMRDLFPPERDLTSISLLLEKLANARLIVKTGDGEQASIEVVHEAIIQNWSRLRDWINNKREFFIWRQARLMPALEKWQATREHFLDHEAAVEAKRWLVEQRSELSSVETEFIFHSLLRAPVDVASWLPSFGSSEEILALLEPYWKDPLDAKRKLGVRALAALPKSDHEEEILRRFQTFVFEDPSLEVATLAGHGLCRRGEIQRLSTILNREPLAREKRDRLIHVLASTRNLPEIGRQIPDQLKKYKRQTQWKAINLLVQEYRNDLALIFVITFLFGLFGNILVSLALQVVGQILLPWVGLHAYDPLNLFASTIGSTDIMIVLIVGILSVIQVRLVDRLPLSKRHLRLAITISLFYSFLFIFISWAGLLSNYQGLERPDLDTFNYSVSTNIVSGIRELLITLVLAVFIVRTVFQHPLIFDRAGLAERSLFASIRCSGLIQIVYMLMGSPFSTSSSLSTELPGFPELSISQLPVLHEVFPGHIHRRIHGDHQRCPAFVRLPAWVLHRFEHGFS